MCATASDLLGAPCNYIPLLLHLSPSLKRAAVFRRLSHPPRRIIFSALLTESCEIPQVGKNVTSLVRMGNACCCCCPEGAVGGPGSRSGRYSVAEAEETRRLQIELWERAPTATSATATGGQGNANGSATAVMGMGRSASGE